MSCNRDGVISQTAGSALGVGDTEVLQMAGRAGEVIWTDDITTVTVEQLPELAGVKTALNLAEANDERRPFVVTHDSDGRYKTFNNIGQAIAYAGEHGGAAYVYEDTPHHPANSPRSPVAIFDTNGEAMMTKPDYRKYIEEQKNNGG